MYFFRLDMFKSFRNSFCGQVKNGKKVEVEISLQPPSAVEKQLKRYAVLFFVRFYLRPSCLS